MTTDKTDTTTESKPEKPKVVYRLDPTQIPQEVRQTVADKLGQQADVYPARNDGGYKGPVLHADKDFIVQAIGKSQNSAVIHRRDDVELKGAALLSRDANNDLPGRNLQVHYRGSDEPGKAYPWDAQREAQQRSQAKEQRVSASDKLVDTATKYAEANISTPKQREAFITHMTNVAKEAFPTRTQDAGKQGAESEKPTQGRKPAAPQRARQDRQPEPALER